MVIRESTKADHDALFALYPAAFPDEDLLLVLRDLLASSEAFSLVAEKDGAVVGHIGFSDCTTSDSNTPLSMLAPLAVAPDVQKQGIGKALIAQGIARLRARNVAKVLVLGDPAYYSGSGFTRENHIRTPYPMPQDWKAAWQSQSLLRQPVALEGQLQVPAFWQKPELWAD
ncbi:MAG: GNAT family N-acetyltransferase [Devosiaceae bacterium]